MAHSKEAHAKKPAMKEFNENHWEKKYQPLGVADGKYATEFGNPEDLERSNNALASYAKSHKMKY